jgi:hypothetical protein
MGKAVSPNGEAAFLRVRRRDIPEPAKRRGQNALDQRTRMLLPVVPLRRMRESYAYSA